VKATATNFKSVYLLIHGDKIDKTEDDENEEEVAEVNV
jgi:hypothetical protein